jgi:hypothetical protein
MTTIVFWFLLYVPIGSGGWAVQQVGPFETFQQCREAQYQLLGRPNSYGLGPQGNGNGASECYRGLR